MIVIIAGPAAAQQVSGARSFSRTSIVNIPSRVGIVAAPITSNLNVINSQIGFNGISPIASF